MQQEHFRLHVLEAGGALTSSAVANQPYLTPPNYNCQFFFEGQNCPMLLPTCSEVHDMFSSNTTHNTSTISIETSQEIVLTVELCSSVGDE
jgi:hypothetical protein